MKEQVQKTFEASITPACGCGAVHGHAPPLPRGSRRFKPWRKRWALPEKTRGLQRYGRFKYLNDKEEIDSDGTDIP